MKKILRNIFLWAFEEDLKNHNSDISRVEEWLVRLFEYLKLEIKYVEGSEGYYKITKIKKLK